MKSELDSYPGSTPCNFSTSNQSMNSRQSDVKVRQPNFSHIMIGITIGIALALSIVSAVIFISGVISEIAEIHQVVIRLEKVD